MGNPGSPSAIDRILQLINTLVLMGILVILALLLVEFKRVTDRDAGLVMRLADGHILDVKFPSTYGFLGHPISPFAVQAIPR